MKSKYAKAILIKPDIVTFTAIERMAKGENRKPGPMVLEIVKRFIERDRLERRKSKGMRV